MFAQLAKARLPQNPSQVRTKRVLTAEENAIAESYRRAVRDIADGVDLQTVQQFVSDGTSRLNLPDVPAAAVQKLADDIAVVAVGEAVRSARSLPQEIVTRYDFEKLDPRAVAYARERSGTFIKQLSDEQRRIVHNSLVEGIEQQLTTKQIAQSIRGQIGLHDKWAKAVESAYESELERLKTTGISLAKAEAQAQKLRERYHDRLVRARAANIARTEVQSAQNMGRFISWLEAGNQKLINPQTTKKEWITGPSNVGAGRISVCEICSAINGEKVSVLQQFSLGVLMPPAHPNCRCTAVIVPVSIEEITELISYSDAEYKAADDILHEASIIEPRVTNDMMRLSGVYGGRLDGLEHRTKTRNSLTRKIANETRFAEKPITTAQAAAEMRDTIRYTIVLDDKQYAKNVQEILADLRRSNPEVRVKTRWTKPDTYHGVNIHVRDATDNWFELQLHTEMSLEKKKQVHNIYEVQRKLDPKSVRFRELQREMETIIDDLVVPRNVSDIPGFNGKRISYELPTPKDIGTVKGRVFNADDLVKLIDPADSDFIAERLTGEMLVKKQKFDSLPTIVSKEQGEALVEDGWTRVFRGVSNDNGTTKFGQQFLDGEYFYGKGVYGNGTYSSTRIRTARQYAGGDGLIVAESGEVLEMFINPAARIIDSDDLRKVYKEVEDEFNKKSVKVFLDLEAAKDKPGYALIRTELTAEFERVERAFRLMQNDNGALAMARGYDVIKVAYSEEETFYVILNRSTIAGRNISNEVIAEITGS